jgi:hypothetical protein
MSMGVERIKTELELEQLFRKENVIKRYDEGSSRKAISAEYSISTRTVNNIIIKSMTLPNHSINGFSVAILKKLYAFGFLNKQEVINVFDFDPRYFLSLPGLGEKSVHDISIAIGKKSPLPLDRKSINFTVTRLVCGDHYDILEPGVPIRSRGRMAWHFFEIATPKLYRVMLDKTGYKICE